MRIGSFAINLAQAREQRLVLGSGRERTLLPRIGRIIEVLGFPASDPVDQLSVRRRKGAHLAVAVAAFDAARCLTEDGVGSSRRLAAKIWNERQSRQRFSG